MNMMWIIILVLIFIIGVLGLVFYIIEEKDKIKENQTMINCIWGKKNINLAVNDEINTANTNILKSAISNRFNEKKDGGNYQQSSNIDIYRGHVSGMNNYRRNTESNFSNLNYRNSMFTDDSHVVRSKTNNNCSSSDSSNSSSNNDSD